MSCSYPGCMMGGGGCPYESDCNKEDEERMERVEAQRQRDIREQELRTALLEEQLRGCSGVLQLGRFELSNMKNGNIWIRKEGGEGMEAKPFALEHLIRSHWEENF